VRGIAKRWHFLNKKIDIPYREFLFAINLVLNSTYFKFNDIIYKQVFGTPMGSPLFPILADIVMQDLEERAISSLSLHFPFYFRYVDDIALAALSASCKNILHVFNSFHKRLQFTIEIADENTLNFLDVSITINRNFIEFDWNRKPTFSGRFLNFFSQHPISHKRGVIIGLTDSVFYLSHPQHHEKNFLLVINILLSNGYPFKFIFNSIIRRLRIF